VADGEEAQTRTQQIENSPWRLDSELMRPMNSDLAPPVNGTQVSSTYDSAKHLLLLTNLTSAGVTLSSFDFTYSSVGNRTQVVEVAGAVVTWIYDPTYQLTNEQRSGARSYNITYSV
jgi:hypothetical protein